MTTKDLFFMNIALAEAQKAFQRGDVPVGAVIVYDNEVLALGSNQKLNDPTAHAEIQAIREAAKCRNKWNLRGCHLYVTLEPCPMCAGACVNARLDSLIFGARDPRAGAVGSLFDILRDSRLNHRCDVREGVLKEKSVALLLEYFQLARRSKTLRSK